MTATTRGVLGNSPSVFSTIKRKGTGYNLDATAVTALGNLTTSSTINDVLDLCSALVERKRAVTATTIAGRTAVKSAEATGIGDIRDLSTSVAFPANQSAQAVDITGTATATAATDANGIITAITITAAGTGYQPGDVISVEQGSGGAGRAVFIVANLA